MKTSTRMLRKHTLHLIVVTRYLCHVSQHELQIWHHSLIITEFITVFSHGSLNSFTSPDVLEVSVNTLIPLLHLNTHHCWNPWSKLNSLQSPFKAAASITLVWGQTGSGRFLWSLCSIYVTQCVLNDIRTKSLTSAVCSPRTELCNTDSEH